MNAQKMTAGANGLATGMMKLQRLLARGAGTMADVCVVDVGAIARWGYETDGFPVLQRVATELHAATSRSGRRFIWVAAMPAGGPGAFGGAELAEVVRQLGVLSITCLSSIEAVTSMFASGSTVELPEEVSIVTADVRECPEHLSVLERNVHSVLDVVDGSTHSYWTQYRDRGGEPLFLPVRQAAVRPDPMLRGRPPGGNAAPRYVRELDAHLLGSADPDAGTPAQVPPPPKYMIESLAQNSARLPLRADELIGRDKVDLSARALLEQSLPPRVTMSSSGSPPIVVVTLDNVSKGAVRLSKLPAYACQAGTTLQVPGDDLTVQSMLREVVRACPDLWVAPRALDMLDYMIEYGIPLPKRVVDPAHCAFALCPDRIALEVAACPSAAAIPRDAAAWLWDVKRKVPAPADLETLVTHLPSVMQQLRARTKHRGLDALIDGDLAPTVPVLATMERRGALIGGNIAGVNAQLDRDLNRLESAFRSELGGMDPYRASPDALLERFANQGIALPAAYTIANDDATNTLQRLAQHHGAVAALVQARSISAVQKWVSIVEDSGDRLLGRYFPEVTGRFGMNAHALQAMPKHVRGANALRGLLVAPPGKRLVAADFSSFELRLIAGLSKDPLLLHAATQLDAFGYLADQFFSHGDPNRRATMKAYWHPFGYGMRERGFVQAQTSIRTDDARSHYETLVDSFSSFLAWRRGLSSTAVAHGCAQTGGGWQRTPQFVQLRRSVRARAHWMENAVASTVVQGLAADIQRWCLRELDRTLPSMGAELIFQNQDEVYAVADLDAVADVCDEFEDVFQRRVFNSGLVPAGIRLVARVKYGGTWGDLT